METKLTEDEINIEVAKILNSEEFKLQLATNMKDGFENYIINDPIGCRLWLLMGLEDGHKMIEILRNEITEIQIEQGVPENERMVW